MIAPANRLAFENSPADVRSAKSAGMSVVAVPQADQFHMPEFALANIKLRSLSEFCLDMLSIRRKPAGI